MPTKKPTKAKTAATKAKTAATKAKTTATKAKTTATKAKAATKTTSKKTKATTVKATASKAKAKTTKTKATDKKKSTTAKTKTTTKKSVTSKSTKKPVAKTIRKPSAKKTKKVVLDLPEHASDLTEKQLLSMPEDMYMNALQRAFFQLRLEEMRRDIVEEIAAARDRLKTPPESGDEVDQAAHVEAQQVDIRIVERKTKLLVNVEAAIVRIQEDDYGYCIETGEPIGIERLLVRPTATLCITSKEVHEAKEKLEEL